MQSRITPIDFGVQWKSPVLRMQSIRSYVQLTKPRITWLILMSTAIGYYFGLPPGEAKWWVLFHTMLGTGLIASGTAALNQWWERDADGLMQRTKNRPLPSGDLLPNQALIFAALLSVVGFADLWFGCNPLTAVLGLLTLATYLFVYTPLKSLTPHATTIGALPGAMPPVIGYAAAAGALTWEAAALFAILFVWQFPHFYSIAWLYREDYSRAGIKMLPVVDPTGESTARQMLIYSVALVPISLVPRYLGMAGNVYFAGALVLSLVYLYFSIRINGERSVVNARRVLLASIVYLPTLYVLLLASRPAL